MTIATQKWIVNDYKMSAVKHWQIECKVDPPHVDFTEMPREILVVHAHMVSNLGIQHLSISHFQGRSRSIGS